MIALLKAFLYKGKETRSFKDGLWKIKDYRIYEIR